MKADKLIREVLDISVSLSDSSKADIYRLLLETIADAIQCVPGDLLVCEMSEELHDVAATCGVAPDETVEEEE